MDTRSLKTLTIKAKNDSTVFTTTPKIHNLKQNEAQSARAESTHKGDN